MLQSEHEGRDQGRSEFTSILEEFCLLSGCHAAILVDQEGEAVDYAGLGTPFDLRVSAAEWRLVLQLAHQGPVLNSTLEFTIRAQARSYFLRCLPEGYALVVHLPVQAECISERPLSHAIRRISAEAGFELSPRETAWSVVCVQEEEQTCRPLRLAHPLTGERLESLDVIGLIEPRHLLSQELGFRVRLASGLEGTLVREALGHWFFEEEIWRT